MQRHHDAVGSPVQDIGDPRALHVIGPLRTGGAQTQLLGLIKAAHGTLWDATVVATSGGSLATDFAELGCPFTVLRRIGSPGLGRIARLRDIIRRNEFDVVHSNLWQSNFYARAAVVGRHVRPGVVISERNVETDRSWLRSFLDRRVSGCTDAYVANTDAVAAFIRRVHHVGTAPVVVIPNAVDRTVFYPPLGFDATSHPPRVGTMGRLDPEKGFDVLIEAIRRLVERDVSVECEIAGEGPLLAELKRQAVGLPVHFRGLLERGEPVASFLRRLDVCLPSTGREGRPNVVLEAIACGLPVVATDIPGMTEILSVRTLVEPGTPTALADALERATQGPQSWLEANQPAPIMDFDDLARLPLGVHLCDRAESSPIAEFRMSFVAASCQG